MNENQLPSSLASKLWPTTRDAMSESYRNDSNYSNHMFTPATPATNFRPPLPSYPQAPSGFNSQNLPAPQNYPANSGAPAIRQPNPGAFPSYQLPNAPPAIPQPNPLLALQNEANNRRLKQLETELEQRKTATSNLQQMGTQLLKGQMDVQEQVLQYQFMLEQCMETLDQQHYIINGQSEELALLRAKMRNFEYIMDTLKHGLSNGKHSSQANPIEDQKRIDFIRSSLQDRLSCSTIHPHIHDITQTTSTKFQPLNLRYRSPTIELSKVHRK